MTSVDLLASPSGEGVSASSIFSSAGLVITKFLIVLQNISHYAFNSKILTRYDGIMFSV